MSITEQQIRDTLRRVYWDMMQAELESKPPKYDRMIAVLTELRDVLCSLVPNRPDIHKEIHENIDIDLIKNMVENNAFDNKNLYQLTIYIVSMIKKFQPPAMDDDVGEWEKNMLDQMEQEFDPAEFLVIFFQSVFHMIEHILVHAKIALENLESA